MFKFTTRLAFILLTLLSLSSFAAETLPLPAEKAFVFSAVLEKNGGLVAEWHVAPGYFIYRDKLRVTTVPASPKRLGAIQWPQSIDKPDPVHGSVRAYEGMLRVTIPLKGKSHAPLTVAVQYQGCSLEGFCYAPIKKNLALSYPFSGEGLHNSPLLMVSDAELPPEEQVSVSTPRTSLLTDQAAATAYLSGHAFIMTVLCFLGLGLLLAFTPCSLPMIPILSSLIVGKDNMNTAKAVYFSLAYILGMALTYAAAGVAIAWVGSGIQAYFQNAWVIGAFSLLFFLLALSMLNVFNLRLPSSWQQKMQSLQNKPQGGHYLGAFFMGCLSTLIVSPCVTAPLVGVLAYIAETGNLLLGASALFALGLGMGLPLLLLGFSAGKYLPKSGPWMEVTKKIFAFLLMGMAIWMLARILPGGVTMFLWACLAVVVSMFLLFADGLTMFWRLTATFGGIIAILYGMVLFIGISLSFTSPLYPFEKLALFKAAETAPVAETKLGFTEVKNMNHLDTLLKQAQAQNKPAILDFYAEWCESCQALEKAVLAQPAVQERLKHFVLLRANVTENNAFDQALLKRYHVVAPPTFLFFNASGHENQEKRIVGEVDHKMFLARASDL